MAKNNSDLADLSLGELIDELKEKYTPLPRGMEQMSPSFPPPLTAWIPSISQGPLPGKKGRSSCLAPP